MNIADNSSIKFIPYSTTLHTFDIAKLNLKLNLKIPIYHLNSKIK